MMISHLGSVTYVSDNSSTCQEEQIEVKKIALDPRLHLSWPPKRRENGAGQLHLGK